MKHNIYTYLFIAALLTGTTSCDKNFEEINIDPVKATSVDPAFLFANAERGSAITYYFYQLEIVQQVHTPFPGYPGAVLIVASLYP